MANGNLDPNAQLLQELMTLLAAQGQIGQPQGGQAPPIPQQGGVPLPLRSPFGSSRLTQDAGFGPAATGVPFIFTGGQPHEPNRLAQSSVALADLALNLSDVLQQRRKKKKEAESAGSSSK